ncbi:MAG: hypothetical protein U0X92_12035 [Anaerolineales bacterium]
MLEEKRPPAEMLDGEPLSQAAQERLSAKVTDEFVARAYGQASWKSPRGEDIVVIDADLSSDCKNARL